MHDLPSNFSMIPHKEGTGGFLPCAGMACIEKERSADSFRSIRPPPPRGDSWRRGKGRLNAQGPSKGSITQDLARGNYRNCASTPRVLDPTQRGPPRGVNYLWERNKLHDFCPTHRGIPPVSWYYTEGGIKGNSSVAETNFSSRAFFWENFSWDRHEFLNLEEVFGGRGWKRIRDFCKLKIKEGRVFKNICNWQ